MYRSAVSVFAAAFLYSLSASAGVSVETDGFEVQQDKSSKYSLEEVSGLRISGKIDKKTAEDFFKFVTFFENSIDKVILESEGGDVEAALQIGEYIRKNHIPVFVDGICYSSCFFIFISSVNRHAFYIKPNRQNGDESHRDGKIGLHRPYLNADGSKGIISEQEVKDMYAKVRSYFSQMNISDELFNLMMNTKPEEMKIFEFDAIFKHMPKIDPVYDEQYVFTESILYGVNTLEVRRRRASADAKCSRVFRADCAPAIMWGISEKLYEARAIIVNEKCGGFINQDDRVRIAKLRHIDKFKDEAFLKRVKCRREAMKGAFDWWKDDPLATP